MPAETISELTADQRLNQLSVILARGVQRYHSRRRRNEPCPEKEVPEILPDRLEVSGDNWLSVSQRHGV